MRQILTLQKFLDLSQAERAALKGLGILGIPSAKIGELDVAQLQQFCNALQDCQQLQTLKLIGHNLGALDAPRLTILGNALQGCLQIQLLDLVGNNFGALDAICLTILGNVLRGCSQLQSLYLKGNNLGSFDVQQLSILTDALQHCLQLQSVNVERNHLGERESIFINSILLNPGVFSINSDNVSEALRQTLKNRYLNSISKKAYQSSYPLLQPWKNGRNLPNDLLRAVIEFEKTSGLVRLNYPVSKAEIDAAFEKGFRHAKQMRARKNEQKLSLAGISSSSSSSSSFSSLSSSAPSQPASVTLTFSSDAPASSAKKRVQSAKHAVPNNAKRHCCTKQPEPLGSIRIRIGDGIEVRKSCRLLNKKKRKR